MPNSRANGQFGSRSVLALLGALTIAAAPARGADTRDIEVQVAVDGEIVRVESSFVVNASPQEVWAVMTDFENMERFVSNLKSSTVVARNGDVVTVRQSGEASFALLKFTFESIRELRLTPHTRIQSRMISGNMRRYEGVTDLSAEGSGTRVRLRSEAVPDKWIPPLLGPRFIAHETREQLSEFRAEILRRKSAPLR